MADNDKQEAEKTDEKQDKQPDTAGETPATYEGWLEGQDESVKTLIGANTSGLKSALEKERETRKDLEKELRDKAEKAEKGSEAQVELQGMADKLQETDRRVDFYDEAHDAGVTNLKLAYTVAVQDGMFDTKGNANFKAMKEAYPELFGATQVTPGNAGTGTQTTPPSGTGMNNFIRGKTGR